ncbi:MAG TPA: isoprenylcysteine carboxylmethyltransferase family protein [Candidatus Paceibacterota bacterium]|nr:isoprenylcysteine carboxylmethyltransferase family protein [Candidatus Paceibacterota bacterium]
MNTQAYLILLCWVVFLVVWLVSAINTKRYARRNMNSLFMRLVIVVIVSVFFSSKTVQAIFVGAQQSIATPPVQWLGVVLCVLGMALAIWARVYLGRNWGMPMSLKQEAELVTTGPYAYVRHPIYSGFMLAALGSALVSVWWFVPLVLFSIYFIYSAKTEEKIMLKEFPDQYPGYMKRTNMLIPFVL